MSGLIPPSLGFIAALIAVIFIGIRLRLFTQEHRDGRYLYVAGGTLILTAACWQIFQAHPDYQSWFVITAYGWLELAQVVILALGLLSCVAALALYHDVWESRREAIADRESRLSILESLQDDAQRPYQVTDLLNIGLREILLHYPEAAGVVFMVHPRRRQFVLIASSRLDKDEVARLEYYPLQRSLVAEALDNGQPLTSNSFAFYDRDGSRVSSRFGSVLVLPFVSTVEKLGGIMLFSEDSGHFDRHDIRSLWPVAGWLAEKVKLARINRELTSSRDRLEAISEQRADLISRLLSSIVAIGPGTSLDEFCRSLVGYSSAESVHVCSADHGEICFDGGSKPLVNLSDNFRTALRESLDRSKPVILNQEAVDDNGLTVVVQSTLVVPLGSADKPGALVFRKSEPPFEVNSQYLSDLEVLASLTEVALRQMDVEAAEESRQLGLEAIIRLLSEPTLFESASRTAVWFAESVARALPAGTRYVSCEIGADSSTLRVTESRPASEFPGRTFELPDDSLLSGVRGAACLFVTGRSAIDEHLKALPDGLVDLVTSATDRSEAAVSQSISALAVCPVRIGDAAATVLFAILDSSRTKEAERLLKLGMELVGLRLAVSRREAGLELGSLATDTFSPDASTVNTINNRLAAVMGSAELLSTENDIPSVVVERLGSITKGLEDISQIIRQATTPIEKADTGAPTPLPDQSDSTLNDAIRAVLDSARISGSTVMAGGRPRETECLLEPLPTLPLASEELRSLFEGALDRFASITNEDEVISITTYQHDDFVYLDISRHPRNFPAVKPVASFGSYRSAVEAAAQRPGDVFLAHLSDRPAQYAFDRGSDPPAYLSFKFPAGSHDSGTRPTGEEAFSILAIDDEAIILDLISAMCSSLGYQVTTATSGEEGISLFQSRHFDLVLVDLAMPGLDGLEVGRRIRQILSSTPEQPQVPVVLITGWHTSIPETDLASAGIRQILSKPFRIEQLSELIASVART